MYNLEAILYKKNNRETKLIQCQRRGQKKTKEKQKPIYVYVCVYHI